MKPRSVELTLRFLTQYSRVEGGSGLLITISSQVFLLIQGPHFENNCPMLTATLNKVQRSTHSQSHLPSVLKRATAWARFRSLSVIPGTWQTKKQKELVRKLSFLSQRSHCSLPDSRWVMWEYGVQTEDTGKGWAPRYVSLQVRLQQPPSRQGTWVTVATSEKQYDDRTENKAIAS